MDAGDDFDLLRLLCGCMLFSLLRFSLFLGDDLGLDLLLVRDLSLDFTLLRVVSSLGLDLLLLRPLLRPSSRRDFLVAWDLTDLASPPRVEDDRFDVTSALLSPSLDCLLGGGGGGCLPLLDDGRLFTDDIAVGPSSFCVGDYGQGCTVPWPAPHQPIMPNHPTFSIT